MLLARVKPWVRADLAAEWERGSGPWRVGNVADWLGGEARFVGFLGLDGGIFLDMVDDAEVVLRERDGGGRGRVGGVGLAVSRAGRGDIDIVDILFSENASLTLAEVPLPALLAGGGSGFALASLDRG